MPDPDPSYLGTRLDRLEGKVDRLDSHLDKQVEQIVRLTTEVANLAASAAAGVTKAVYDRDVKSLDDRVSDLEGWRDWIVRIVVGAVVLALLGLVVAKGGV